MLEAKKATQNTKSETNYKSNKCKKKRKSLEWQVNRTLRSVLIPFFASVSCVVKCFGIKVLLKNTTTRKDGTLICPQASGRLTKCMRESK